jgi:hypothetical protein
MSGAAIPHRPTSELLTEADTATIGCCATTSANIGK